MRPSRPANVAAACRAMKNMGLRSLWLVDPKPGLEEPAARALAYGAWDVLDAARTAREPARGGLRERRRGRHERPRRPRRVDPAAPGRRGKGAGRGAGAQPRLRPGGHRPPRRGAGALPPAGADSLRPGATLPEPRPGGARARLRAAAGLPGGGRSAGRSPTPRLAPARATSSRRSCELREGLLEVGYLDAQNPDHILAELRGLLTRAQPTPREVLLLRGLAKQVAWAGRIARGRGSAR